MSNLICAWHTRYFPGEPAVIRAVGENFGGDTHGICPRCYELLFAEAGEMLIPAELETRFVADCTAWQQAGHTRTACHARLAIYQALLKLRGARPAPLYFRRSPTVKSLGDRQPAPLSRVRGTLRSAGPDGQEMGGYGWLCARFCPGCTVLAGGL